MAAGDGISFGAEIFGEFAFHDLRGFEGHRIVDFVEFGQKAEAKKFYSARGFDSIPVILESFIGRKSAHTNIDAWLGGVAIRIGNANFGQVSGFGGKQNDVDMMVMGGRRGGFDSSKGAASHLQNV